MLGMNLGFPCTNEVTRRFQALKPVTLILNFGNFLILIPMKPLGRKYPIIKL